MSSERRSGRLYVDDFEKLTMDDVRRMLGGRPTLRKARAVTIHLPSGRDVYVSLVRVPANRGGGQVVYLKCPVEGCLFKARVLRIVPDEPGLMCVHCLQRKYQASYLSQERSSLSASSSEVHSSSTSRSP